MGGKLHPGDASAVLKSLRTQAERLLETDDDANPLTENILLRLLEVARDADNIDYELFARRHLAEIYLSDNAWQAALQLRQAIALEQDDDVLHALMGLAQAVLGNYGAAMAAYRRALAIAPGTPWYHHNLGYLIDVVVNDPKRAEFHLRTAYLAQPEHHEVAASLARCLCRLGQATEANALIEKAIALAPDPKIHRNLAAWIENGGRQTRKRRLSSPAERETFAEQVAQMLEAQLQGDRLARALRLSEAYINQADTVPRPRDASVFAGATEYLLNVVEARAGVRAQHTRKPVELVTQREVAVLYGVSAGALGRRARQIQRALDLFPGDPRFTA